MTIYSVYDTAFNPYGQVHTGYDTAALLEAAARIPLPESGVSYEPSLPALEETPDFADFRDRAFGGMPVELGLCWGRNTRLNCLEYHRDSEFNLGVHDFILLLARQDEIENGLLDTGKVRAFRVPAGTLVEVYATTLHYAPCHVSEADGFRTVVALPRGTNVGMPDLVGKSGDSEDRLLFARNKWLLAHPDADEVKKGAYVGLTGENIDLSVQK